MDPYGKNELITFYNRHLNDFGDHPQAVRWTPEGQLLRYEAFLNITGDLPGKSVLDFGCGKGDFYGFLKSKGISPDYCGIDVNENLIRFAGSKYPDGEFIAADLEEDPFDRTFDIVMACGVFNLRIGGIKESMENLLKKLFALCREAFHFDALSYYTARRDVELHYVMPEEMLKFALNELSSRVIVRHDWVKGDFFMSLYRS
jgi:SAM-dependent methyltransferase